MLHTENRIAVHAPPEVVFRVAADIADWPRILPHYRYVRVTREDGDSRSVDMGARRSVIPVRWSSIQELREEAFEIAYRHTRGVTSGMDVLWRIRPGPVAVDVSIDHDLATVAWWLRPRVVQYIVGTVFVMHIADCTLRGVKQAAERLAQGEA